MKIGLKPGAKGADVKRLHRVLIFAGFRIKSAEIKRGEFGPSTLEAVKALQSQRRLRARNEIDASMHAVLLEIEQNITINVDEDKPSPKPPAQDEHHGIVRGKLVNEDGAPVSGTRVSLFAKQVRSETHLGDAKTGKQGQYSIAYHRPSAFNLVVRAHDASGKKVIAESATAFAAPAQIQINFTTAADGVVRSPSTYTTIKTRVAAPLCAMPFKDLRQNKDTHDLQFLANSIGAPFDDVAYLFIAHLLGTKNEISDETFFGVFYQGVPASLDAALASLSDAGIDDAFTAQVLGGVLAHSRDSLSQVLTDAVNANALPASYAVTRDAQLTRLDDLRTQNVASAPYIRGKTSLHDLLAVGGVADAAKTAFTQAYSDNSGQLGPTWKTLRANKNLSPADLVK